MKRDNNVNEARFSINPIYNDNNNVIDDKYAVARRVEEIADKLISSLGLTTSSREFMCKVAWKLPEARIWSNLERAQSAKKSKPGLFIWLCKRDGV